jgi:hypothetical protein
LLAPGLKVQPPTDCMLRMVRLVTLDVPNDAVPLGTLPPLQFDPAS